MLKHYEFGLRDTVVSYLAIEQLSLVSIGFDTILTFGKLQLTLYLKKRREGMSQKCKNIYHIRNKSYKFFKNFIGACFFL